MRSPKSLKEQLSSWLIRAKRRLIKQPPLPRRVEAISAESAAGRRLLALASACADRSWLAKADNELCGVFSGKRPTGCGALYIKAGEARITALLVRRPYRGQGYGRLLLAALEARARSSGALRIRVSVNIKDAEALNLLLMLGYRACRYDASEGPFNIMLEKALLDLGQFKYFCLLAERDVTQSILWREDASGCRAVEGPRERYESGSCLDGLRAVV
jgi:GNAT superfamily N-acetyltransferase